MGYYVIIRNISSFHESNLEMTYNFINDLFCLICNNFRENFINKIT